MEPVADGEFEHTVSSTDSVQVILRKLAQHECLAVEKMGTK